MFLCVCVRLFICLLVCLFVCLVVCLFGLCVFSDVFKLFDVFGGRLLIP